MRTPSLASRVRRLASRAAPPGADPGWVHALTRLLEDAERFTGADSGTWNSSPAEAALAPLLAAAEASLKGELARARAAVLPSARRELVGVLSRRLVAACVRVLALEHRVRPLPGAHPAEWVERFEHFPVLAWLMGHILQGWRAHTREMLRRWKEDRPLLTQSLLGGKPPGALAGVLGDAGDVHAGGRSVTVLRFEDGRRAVYKPRDSRITRAVLELCAFLNASGLPLPLHVRAVVAREHHGWEEFIPAAPCHTPAEVERFFFRVGMLARLMQLLEAADLWADNLVAAGEHPVLVDLETVLQPRLPPRPGPQAKREAEDWLRESVVPLGLLSAPTPIAPGVPAQDLGGLASARTFLTPRRSAPLLEALAGGVQPSREGYLLWNHPEHVPTLMGEPVPLESQLEPLLEGYRAMHAALHRQREALLGTGSPLMRMAGLPVRYVHRTTWTCHRWLQAGLAPSLLVDQTKREALLADVPRAAEPHPEPASERAVTQAEVDAVRALDIPALHCRTDARALLDADGRVLDEGFFHGSALERARQRLLALDAFALERHEALVCSTLACGHPDARPPGRAAKVTHEEAPDWLAEAIAVGDRLLEEGLGAGGWVGREYEPHHALWRMAVLPPDLLTGTAGIAVVLAELHAASGQARFREATLGALESTRLAVMRREHGPWEAEAGEVGGFRGTGAHLYALHRCAITLGMPELTEAARSLVASLPLAHIGARAPLDLVTGAPGLLLVLAACGLVPAASVLAEALAPRLSAAPPSAPPADFPLRCLPPPASGWALCAARLREAGIPAPWPPLPLPSPTTSGALLARLALGEGDALRERLRHALEEAASGPASERLDGLELALVAASRTGEPLWREHAERLGRRLLAEHRAQGRWFPDRLAADAHEPSALWGLGAVAYALLRLHAPGHGPSLRLLEADGSFMAAGTR